MEKDPFTPQPVPQELSKCSSWASTATPRHRSSWPPRTCAPELMATRPALSGESKLSYQLAPMQTGCCCSASSTSAREKQCRYPEIRPMFFAACAADGPVDPSSSGGEPAPPSSFSAAE